MSNPKPWAAAVVRAHVSWLAAGKYLEHAPTPSWVSDEPARLVALAGAAWFGGRPGGTVLYQPLGGIRDRAAFTSRLLTAAERGGWHASRRGAETGWFTFTRRDGGPTVAFGVGPWIAQHRTTLFRLDEPANIIAGRLADYERLTGTAWRGTAGMSGCAGIREAHEAKTRGGQPLWRWDKAPAGVIGCAWELRGSAHHRPMTADERKMRHVLMFDTRAGYLSAASLAELGWSAPRPLDEPAFDYRQCGYWVVKRDELPVSGRVGGVPLSLLVKPGDTPTVPLTTPVMTYLYEQGVTPAPVAAWAAERTGRHLRAWSERLRDARAAGGDTAGAVKDTYSRTVGMLGRAGGRIYRPDWRDEIIDRARINLIRKVARAGVRPLRWNVDAVWVATDEEPEVIGARLGAYDTTQHRWRPEIGKLKVDAALTPEEYEQRYEGRA